MTEEDRDHATRLAVAVAKYILEHPDDIGKWIGVFVALGEAFHTAVHVANSGPADPTREYPS